VSTARISGASHHDDVGPFVADQSLADVLRLARGQPRSHSIRACTSIEDRGIACPRAAAD
jgi:hypothetical protein